jgi:hypothetical protein
MNRTDYKPSEHDRAVLAGRRPHYTSPGYELASRVRKLNTAIGALPANRQAQLQPDWNASWSELKRQLETARDDDERHEYIRSWSRHWLERLG